MHRRVHLLYPKSLPYIHRALRLNHHATPNSVASHLKSRSVIRFSGPDTVKFLQGLLTNDVRKFGGEPDGERTSYVPTPNVAQISVPPMYAAMLNPQGRFLYDLFLYRKPRSDEMLDRTGSGPGSDPHEDLELFADVDTEVLDEAVMMFKRYRLRAKVEIENVAKEFSCWQRFGESFSETSPRSEGEEPEAASIGWGSSVDQSAMSSAHGIGSGWQWFSDPRLDCLGFRGIFPSDTIPPLVEADKETDDRNYILWRLEKGVAEGSTEIPKGEAIPLEYNLAGLNAISFDKGCYVGQELVARTHHRGVIRKRVLPLKFIDNDGKEVKDRVTPGSEVVEAGSGKKIGTVRTVLGCRGLGLLRLEEALKGSGSLTIQGQEDVNVDARRPDWWPNEWFQENERHSVAS